MRDSYYESLIGEKNSCKIVRLENEVVISELALEWSKGDHMYLPFTYLHIVFLLGTYFIPICFLHTY